MGLDRSARLSVCLSVCRRGALGKVLELDINTTSKALLANQHPPELLEFFSFFDSPVARHSRIIVLFTFICPQPTLSLVHVCSARLFSALPLAVVAVASYDCWPFAGRYYKKLKYTPAVRSKISSKLIFASCV